MSAETPAVSHTPTSWILLNDFVATEEGNFIAEIDKSRVIDSDEAHENGRLIVAACNSYAAHFGPDAVAASEEDQLGKALAAISRLDKIWRLQSEFANGEGSGMPVDAMHVSFAMQQARAVLSRVKEGK